MSIAEAPPSDHAFRVTLSEIMHARSLPLRAVPVRVRQWLVLHEEDQGPAIDAWLATLDEAAGASDPRHVVGRSGDCDLVWERHNEFSTITAIRTGPGTRHPIANVPWLRGLPGAVFRSVEILVGQREDFDWESDARFDPSRLVSSIVFDGAARIWSDFTIKENGGGRIVVEDQGLQNDELARLVQTLIEIGNYRKLALLGFPIARELMPWLTTVEARHSAITERHNAGGSDSGEVLSALLALSSEIEHRASQARFRLGATSSYHVLTTDRLRALRETRVGGFSTTAEFIERRLLPAMRTCEVAQHRLESLSERINRTASLLSLEQSIMLNRRNQAILASLNRRSAMQLRLQNLVEGFSIFAISYYIIAIIEKPIEAGVHWAGYDAVADHAVALIVLPVLLLTWKALERSKKHKRPA